MTKRTREIIYKPIFKGASISWVTKYFRNRFMSFKKEHIEFDTFLKELVAHSEDNKYVLVVSPCQPVPYSLVIL